MNLLPHLLRPARGGAAGVVVVFAVLLAIGSSAGMAGIPLSLIIFSWFFKYAYILFDHVVRGFDEPPTLDISMLNPVDEQRPLLLLVLLGIAAALAFLIRNYSPATALCWVAAALLVLPAAAAVLGLEGNVVKAVSPVALFHMIRGLGVMYAAVLGIITLIIIMLSLIDRLRLWLPLSLALSLFGGLSVFSLLGGALYERRFELGLETWHSPERAEEKRRAAALRDDERVVTEAYGQVRVGAHSQAWAELQKWLESRGHEVADYRWLRDQVMSWPDPRYATRLTEEFVDRLLAARRFGDAVDAVRDRLRLDPKFRPASAAATLQVAELAARGGGAPTVARILLGDFAERFPGDSHAAAAAELARHFGE